MEAIILCGGSAKRMKPYLSFSKALAKIKDGVSLLEYQIDWLINAGIDRIILAIDRKTYRTLRHIGLCLRDQIVYSIEEEKLGTGGAVSNAVNQVESQIFYLMNVDDILLSETYTPSNLLGILQENKEASGSILLTRARFPFGIVETSNFWIKGFKQKPWLNYKICSGHYAFTKEGIRRYFPQKEDFENTALQQMAQNNCLISQELDGEWITVNNIKQLEAAKQRLMIVPSIETFAMRMV